MMDPRLEDHVVGLELQIVELEERRKRADVQGRPDAAGACQQEIEALRAELVASAEVLAS
jgi:hypothetical protein